MTHDHTANGQDTPMRSRHPWWLIAALALGGFGIGTSEFATMSVLPGMARDLGVDEPTAGRLISAYAMGVVVGAPLIAVLAARMPRRRLLLALMMLYAAAHTASAFVDSFGGMMATRFVAGLPHGAYFGVAALVAAAQVSHAWRARAVASVIMGLTVATVVGVPASEMLGRHFGWRPMFAFVAALSGITMLAVGRLAPHDRPDPEASPMRELQALKRPQVLLVLATGAIGFAGMFSMYTYLASTLDEVTHVEPAVVPVIFAVFGLGMTVGHVIGAWAADRALMPTPALQLLWSAAMLALYPLAAGNPWTMALDVFAIALGGGLGTVLQTRLMDVAGDAQTLAAALNHSAFNLANALGPWLGGMAIHAGLGWTSTGPVGGLMALAGLLIWLATWALARQAEASPVVSM